MLQSSCRSQHIFIDPEAPQSAHGMSYNCVGFSGNQRSFNDGYHTIHHLNSKLHWTELPQKFSQTVEKGWPCGIADASADLLQLLTLLSLHNFSCIMKC